MGLRIFAGSLKGIPLTALKGNAIRPTSGRTREAIFNILSSRIQTVSVLDLFAGSGALGIETLSRGARQAVFIDDDLIAISILNKNIRRCRLEAQSRVIRWDIRANLDCLAGFSDTFDLVFIDPPYDQGVIAPALRNLKQSGSLKREAVIVVEHGSKERVEYPGFHIADQRTYGKTLVSFLTDVL